MPAGFVFSLGAHRESGAFFSFLKIYFSFPCSVWQVSYTYIVEADIRDRYLNYRILPCVSA